jgi:hypothetical protein
MSKKKTAPLSKCGIHLLPIFGQSLHRSAPRSGGVNRNLNRNRLVFHIHSTQSFTTNNTHLPYICKENIYSTLQLWRGLSRLRDPLRRNFISQDRLEYAFLRNKITYQGVYLRERPLKSCKVEIYPNNLKNGEFDMEAAQNFCLERMTIADRQGMR